MDTEDIKKFEQLVEIEKFENFDDKKDAEESLEDEEENEYIALDILYDLEKDMVDYCKDRCLSLLNKIPEHAFDNFIATNF